MDALYEPANWTISTSISKEKVSPLLRMDDRDDWEATVASVLRGRFFARQRGEREGMRMRRGKEEVKEDIGGACDEGDDEDSDFIYI